jgi:hypothetical protein
MLSELLSILLDKPEKIRALFIKFVKLVLSLILASHAYVWIIGPYKLINYLNVAQWVEFIMSGRILIVLLIFIAADFVIFSFLPAFTTGFLILLARKLSYKGDLKDERQTIRGLLKFLRIIEIEKESKRVLPGPNARYFEAAMEYMASDEGKDDFFEMRNSYLNGIVHTYLIFALIFSLYFNQTSLHSMALCVYIIGVLLCVFYFFLSFILSILEKNAASLLYDIKLLRIARTLKEAYVKYEIYAESKPNKPLAAISLNGKKVNIYWMPMDQLIEEFRIEWLIKEAIGKGSSFKILTNGDLTASARKLYEKNLNVCEILHYSDEVELLAHVKSIALMNEPELDDFTSIDEIKV